MVNQFPQQISDFTSGLAIGTNDCNMCFQQSFALQRDFRGFWYLTKLLVIYFVLFVFVGVRDVAEDYIKSPKFYWLWTTSAVAEQWLWPTIVDSSILDRWTVWLYDDWGRVPLKVSEQEIVLLYLYCDSVFVFVSMWAFRFHKKSIR